MSRKIKNARDLSTDELIYFKSHAQATFMSDGTTVEDKINNLQAGGADLTEYAKKSELASVATSGSYNDLSNKPTIPSAVTESTVSGWGFTKNTGTYSKPSGGIPKTDLASAVQTSLGKADTALQSYTEQYKGTITGVSANGTSVATSGVANIPAASTSAYGVTKLSNSTNSTSTTLAATASAVRSAYNLANGKYSKPSGGIPVSDLAADAQNAIYNSVTRDTFGELELIQIQGFEGSLSGMLYALPSEATGDEDDIILTQNNIKTINGQSIIGSGDITISGGGSGGSGAYSEVNHGTSDTTFTLTPNTFHIWDEVASLTLDFGSETAGVANEFLFQFTSGSESTSLILPDDIKWTNDEAPVIEANKIYQISILKGLGSVLAFDNTPPPAIILIKFTIDSSSFNAESGMMWSEWIVSNYNTAGYIGIEQNKVINNYTNGNLFTISGGTVNSSDVIQPIKYTFTNPWA